jgi:hypothetical protein
MLDERLKVWNGKAIARPLLAAPQIDVAEFAILHESSYLIISDAEVRGRLANHQESGLPGRLQGVLQPVR